MHTPACTTAERSHIVRGGNMSQQLQETGQISTFQDNYNKKISNNNNYGEEGL